MSIDTRSEIDRLKSIAADSWYAKGVNADIIRYSAKIFSRYWSGTHCLELGPAEGMMTEMLAQAFPELTAVEGSDKFCEDLRRRFPSVKVVCSLFEDFQTDQLYDTVVLGHVLEHVDSPRAILEKVRSWVAPGGKVCAAVPNARSLHRQAGVIMGMIPTEHALNDTDMHHGHRRVYDPESLRADFNASGFKILMYGGYWIKPLSGAQIEQTWTQPLIDAFMELGERYPDIAADIYIIATPA